MNEQRIKAGLLPSLLAALSLGVPAAAGADTLDKVLQVSQATNDAAAASQAKVDRIADETRKKINDYKQVLKEIEGLKVYVARLDKQIADQEQRIADTEQAIADASAVKRQIIPLVERMIGALEEFVAADMPFRIEKRNEELEMLKSNLDRSDISDAEKFRQALEAYKIESEYGRFLETYKQEIDGREVNVLRVGRVALMYQTDDGEETAAFDPASRAWVPLESSEYKNAVTKGIRIAEKQASIDVLKLPVSAPEAL